MTTKNLNQAVVGDKITQFGVTVLVGPAEVISVDHTSYGVASVHVRVADGRRSFYPAAGMLGERKIVVQ